MSISGYGEEFEHQISKATAKQLCGMYPLPEMGYEVLVAFARDQFQFINRLYVQNVSGTYVLASSQLPKSMWEKYFGIKPLENNKIQRVR